MKFKVSKLNSNQSMNSFSTGNLYISNMEWYIKNRWWIWSVTGAYLAYRIYLSLVH